MLACWPVVPYWVYGIQRYVNLADCYFLFLLGAALAFCGILPADGFVLFAALTVAQGIVVPFFSGPFTSLLQTQFKPAYLGRVFSLFDSVSLLPSIIGLFITGFIADSLGIANIFYLLWDSNCIYLNFDDVHSGCQRYGKAK